MGLLSFRQSTLKDVMSDYTSVQIPKNLIYSGVAKTVMKTNSKSSVLRCKLQLPACTGILAGAALLFAQAGSVNADQKTLRYNSGDDALAIYSFGLAQKALAHSKHDWHFQEITGEIPQARSIEMVRSGKLDILWTATNQDMEDTLLPVRIPLLKGLLGHRIFIIQSANQSRFDSVRSLDDLSKLTMGQGSTWTDTMILRHNGINVVPANKYDSLFYMVDGGRFDAFPRGVQEPWAEIASRPELDLSVERNIMLVYKMPFYLFVSPDNFELANELESGLRKMIADGSFHQYFISDPTVQDVVSKSNIKNRRSFQLVNPTLPAKTPVDEAELWLDPAEL